MAEIKMTRAEEVLIDIVRVLRAGAKYHSGLKIISSKANGSNASRGMWEHLCREAGSDNSRLHELSNQVKYLTYFSGIQEFFMTIFGGYRQI